MMLTKSAPTASRLGAAAPSRASRRAVVTQAKPKLDSSGFVKADNSGKGNMFPQQTKAFYSSPTSEAAARQGLGGVQGLGVLLGAVGLVGLATAGVLNTGSGETLATLQSGAEIESLSAVAARIAASL